MKWRFNFLDHKLIPSGIRAFLVSYLAFTSSVEGHRCYVPCLLLLMSQPSNVSIDHLKCLQKRLFMWIKLIRNICVSYTGILNALQTWIYYKHGCLNIRLTLTHIVSHLIFSSDSWLICWPLIFKSSKKLLLRLVILPLLNFWDFFPQYLCHWQNTVPSRSPSQLYSFSGSL